MGNPHRKRPKTPPPYIAIGMPSRTLFKDYTVASLMSLSMQIMHDWREPSIIHTTGRTEVCRNRICDMAIERGCSHVLFIDSDMVFPSKAARVLVQADAEGTLLQDVFFLARLYRLDQPLSSVQCFLHRLMHLFWLDRLEQVTVHAFPNGGHGRLQRAVGGQDDNRRVWPTPLDRLQHPHAIHLAA